MQHSWQLLILLTLITVPFTAKKTNTASGSFVRLVSGSVTIHPSVAIAPGVLFQTDPESQIIIAAGACIGIGVILHTHKGILEVV